MRGKKCGRFIKGGKYPIIILGSVENFENSISNGAYLSISVRALQTPLTSPIPESFVSGVRLGAQSKHVNFY